ncbi:MAG: helicase C-terminal domain-containing protein [Pseudomonadota bacterium]
MFSLSIRQLAEFAFRCGDLYPSGGGTVDAQEGIRVQQVLQRKRQSSDPLYEAERTFGFGFEAAGGPWKLSGRADGYLARPPLIEEFKTVTAHPEQYDPVDLGQALLYAGCVAQELLDEAGCNEDAGPVRVRLTYVRLADLAEKTFEQTLDAATARDLLAFCLLLFHARQFQHLQRTLRRATAAAALDFPFASYRRSQRAIARRVYRAVQARENLLLEAPTGSGKSLAVLYPTIKALQPEEQAFVLTSRNLGAVAMLDALARLDADAQMVTVQVTAKEKTCFVAGMPCRADLCPYAKGYFDRSRSAVNALLREVHVTRDVVERYAQAYKVCPYELSLDAAVWADVIIGDYNYIFDPQVRLRRFVKRENMHLLIDEAHQLSPRIREMLSVSLSRDVARRAKDTFNGTLASRVRSLDRALGKIRKGLTDGEHQLADVATVDRAVQRLVESVAEEDVELVEHPLFAECYFECLKWQRSAGWMETDSYVHLAQVDGGSLRLTRLCLDPAGYMARVMGEYAAVVRFSATVSPLDLYQRLHGMDMPGAAERADGPFRDDQVGVFVVPDIPTYFKARQRSLHDLCCCIQSITSAQTGRYLISLPSYAYLAQLQPPLEQGCDGLPVLFQERQMDDEQRADLLADFKALEHAALLVVAGGVFAESVDFGDARLSGVVIVGLGLPPPSLAADLVAQYFDQQNAPAPVDEAGRDDAVAEAGKTSGKDGKGSIVGRGEQGDKVETDEQQDDSRGRSHERVKASGQLVAYMQPALVKNVQVAGRLLRKESDRGVICLIDERFLNASVRRFLPSLWRPEVLRHRDLHSRLQRFWADHPEHSKTRDSEQTLRS